MNIRLKAFTLIELLVVISIIAMLLAILMPALAAVKEKGRLVVCLTRQKNLLLGWKLYSQDNNGKLVGAHTAHPVEAYSSWVDVPANQSLEEKKEACKRGLLYQYMEIVDIYHCPSDKRDFDYQQNAWRTFSIFDCMNGGGWGGPQYKKQSQIPTSSTKMVFLEEYDPRGWNMGSWVIQQPTNLDNFTWIDGMGVFHKDSSTFSFADGHVEPHKWQDKRTLQLFEDMKDGRAVPNGNGMATHDGSVDVIYIKQAWAD